jgi:hypothetical protein
MQNDEVFMKSRLLIGAMLVFGVMTVGTVAVGDIGATHPSQQWIIASLLQPTVIAGVVAQGTVVIVHDDAKMSKGEPCTSVYRWEGRHGRREEIVSFMCEPVQRDAVQKFTMTCARPNLDGINVMLEYQFPNDTEAHRVPSYVK